MEWGFREKLLILERLEIWNISSAVDIWRSFPHVLIDISGWIHKNTQMKLIRMAGSWEMRDIFCLTSNWNGREIFLV